MASTIKRCIQYDLFKLKAVTGQMYYCTDTNVLYKDNGPNKESRTRFNAIIVNTNYERLNSIKPVIGKFYYVKDTNELWMFDTRWRLRISESTAYNTYAIAGEPTSSGGHSYLSPIINASEFITGKSGDKIIDNNGLLGDGSVIIRDSNRIARGIISADLAYQHLVFNSYLDNGFLFLPNSHLPYNNLSTSLGALHLGVDREINSTNSGLNLSGQARYYGTWNNYGDMYVIDKIEHDGSVGVDYTPNLDEIILKIFIKCSTTKKEYDGSSKKVTTYITIRPISTTEAIANIASVNANTTDSVVFNDLGEMLVTGADILEENTTFDCTRKITYANGHTICTYSFINYETGVDIVLKQNSSEVQIELPAVWSESGIVEEYKMSLWKKNKVLTSNDIDITSKRTNNIRRITY